MHQQEVQEDKPKISGAVLAGADHKTNEQIIELALKSKKRWWRPVGMAVQRPSFHSEADRKLAEGLQAAGQGFWSKSSRLDKLQNRIQIEKHKRSLPDYVHRLGRV